MKSHLGELVGESDTLWKVVGSLVSLVKWLVVLLAKHKPQWAWDGEKMSQGHSSSSL